MLTCVQIPSREIGRLSNKMISNVKLKVEISNVKADLKNTLFFFNVCCFFPVNTEYV